MQEKRGIWGGSMLRQRPEVNQVLPPWNEADRPIMSQRHAKLSLCTGHKDQWTMKKQEMCPRHNLFCPSDCGTFVPPVPCLSCPSLVFEWQLLIFQVSIMSCFFTAFMVWNYQVHLLMHFFSLFASQCSVYIVDEWTYLDRRSRPLLRIQQALDLIHEWLGQM